MMDTDSAIPMNRPALVWVICIVYAVGLIVALGSLYSVFSGALVLPDKQAQFYRDFGYVNFGGLILSTILGITSMIQLFRLRKNAPYFITALFLVGVLKQLWYQPDLVRLGQGLALPVVSEIVALLIVIYSWHLLRRGVLR